MMSEEKVLMTIYRAVDEVNAELETKEKIVKSTETILYGKNANLDSIILVNLIVTLEEKIEEEFGITLTLADEKAMSQKTSPFKSIRTLSDYIIMLLNEYEGENG